MSSLIVQTDDGLVSNANGYIDNAYAINYWAARGVTLPDDEKLSQAIILASDYADQRFTYKGERLNGRNQRTQWPRKNIQDVEGYDVNGIPNELKEVISEYAKRILVDGITLAPDKDPNTPPILSKSEGVSTITESVTYGNGGRPLLPSYPAADNKLKVAGFLAGSFGGLVGSLVRG